MRRHTNQLLQNILPLHVAKYFLEQDRQPEVSHVITKRLGYFIAIFGLHKLLLPELLPTTPDSTTWIMTGCRVTRMEFFGQKMLKSGFLL